MLSVLLVYPVSLFKNNALLDIVDHIYIIEDPIYFTKFNFHKMKLILHRATCKYYYDYLNKITNKKIYYIDHNKVSNKFYQDLFTTKYNNIHLYDPIDHNLIDKLYKYLDFNKSTISELNIYDSPAFPESLDDIYNYLSNNPKKNKSKIINYTHDSSFYRWQRRRMNILMKNDKPLYDKWSFDKENRSPFNSTYIEPKLPKYQNSKYIKEAYNYINRYFKNNFGSNNLDNFLYPITHDDAKKLLNDFIKNKLKTFGKYEDAISKDILIGSHSFLSSSMNIGLITADEIINAILKVFDSKLINSIEAFIRQIIGWRSYMRMIYEIHGRDIIKMNALKHNYKINDKWFNGTTKIEPIDHTIKKVYNYAYFHHIERLMLMGNFTLLTKLDPYDTYKWYMIVSIDSYDWVMLPNVYGMIKYATTSFKIMTKPYFSSSNYLKKMSDFKDSMVTIDNNKLSWMEIWNSLYYNFINDNYQLVRANYGTANMAIIWNKKSASDKKKILDLAKLYFNYIHR
jgi:deoxyribodipyrimidine photolyase-related protein